MTRLAIDVGGTNTDVILEMTDPSGKTSIATLKVPTTRGDESVGVVEGVRAICAAQGVKLSEISEIFHGTTTATNTLLEYDGARVGMLTTRGFRDILHIARHKRPLNFSLHFDVPWQSRPLVRRRDRLVVRERILPPDGSVMVPLDESEVEAAAEEFKTRGIRAIIICFLFSFLNPAHELRAEEIIRKRCPDAVVLRSSGLVNVMREYERFSTTAASAYVGLKVRDYLERLKNKLAQEGFTGEVRVMQSDGTLVSTETAVRNPITLAMSGPAAGVVAGQYFSGSNQDQIITADVGGTSADISCVTGSRLVIKNARETEIGGYSVLTPMLDITTIGAGGGSVAELDEAGGFHVGPRSAGAVPGPACYGRGGKDATVTDANVVLGRLDATRMLGGRLIGDADAARKAVGAVGDKVGLNAKEAALGILRLVNNNMALAIRSVSVARGIDPRSCLLVAYGGAGGLHAAALAQEIGVQRVLVPPAPGVAAAAGLLLADVAYEAAQGLFGVLEEHSTTLATEIAAVVGRLTDQCAHELQSASSEEVTYEVYAECRYTGQGFELRVPVDTTLLEKPALLISHLKEAFHERHQTDYGYHFSQVSVELITLRVRGVIAERRMPWDTSTDSRSEAHDGKKALPTSTRTVVDANGAEHQAPWFDWNSMAPGTKLNGIAGISGNGSTVYVPPSWTCEVQPDGGLLLSPISSQ